MAEHRLERQKAIGMRGSTDSDRRL